VRFPEVRDDCRAKDTGWIHGRAGERPAEKNIELDRRADRQSSYSASTFIHASPMDDKHEKRTKFFHPRLKQRRWQKTIALLAVKTAIAFAAQPPA
jgi:hypothetical protein